VDYLASLGAAEANGVFGWWFRWRTAPSNLMGGYQQNPNGLYAISQGYERPSIVENHPNVYTFISGWSSLQREELAEDDRRIDELDNTLPYRQYLGDDTHYDLSWTIRGERQNAAVERAILKLTGEMPLTENTKGDWQTPLHGVLVGLMLDFTPKNEERCGWGWGPGWMLVKGSAR
jgi:hypothetical protein